MLVFVLTCSVVSDSLRPMDYSPPGSSVHGFSRQEYWSGLLFPTSRDLLNPGIKPMYLMSPALAGGFFTTGHQGMHRIKYPLWHSYYTETFISW